MEENKLFTVCSYSSLALQDYGIAIIVVYFPLLRCWQSMSVDGLGFKPSLLPTITVLVSTVSA